MHKDVVSLISNSHVFQDTFVIKRNADILYASADHKMLQEFAPKNPLNEVYAKLAEAIK